MSTTFILAQVCGFLILICTAVGIQMKNKTAIVLSQLIANILSIAQYMLLWALTGAAIALVNTFRCLVFYLYARKDKRPHLAIFLLFEALAIVAGVLTWQSWWSLLPIVISLIFTYGLWQTNTFIIKLTSIITSSMRIVYNIAMMAYVGVAQQVVQATSSIIAIIRVKLDEKKTKKESVESAETKQPDIQENAKQENNNDNQTEQLDQ